MRIMLFGAAGQVGADCNAVLCNNKNDELKAITRQQVDFSERDQVIAAVRTYQPDIVINACAYTMVDKAETESILADKVNHLSVAGLAAACADVDALLIHLSTDYVFDGKADFPYDEQSQTNPLTVYGKTKRLGELAVIQSTLKYIILRTSWVFGQRGNNFVKTMLRLSNHRDEIRVVDDQVGCPTYTGHIVSVISWLIERYRHNSASLDWGIYHCCNRGTVSWYEFAVSVFEEACAQGVLAVAPEVKAIPSSAYPVPAPRPMYSVLNPHKLETLTGQCMPSWREGLSCFFSQKGDILTGETGG